MAAAVDEFIEFLLLEMEDTASTAFVDAMLASARAALSGKGELGFLTTGAMNGKTFARAQELTALQVARGCREALRIRADAEDGGGRVASTGLDFSHLAL